MQAPSLFDVPGDFILFGLTLAGVALFHKCTMRVDLTALVTIVIYKIAFTGFQTADGVMGFVAGFAVMLGLYAMEGRSKKRHRHGQPGWLENQVSSNITRETTWQPR